jgi:hypothetical protein
MTPTIVVPPVLTPAVTLSSTVVTFNNVALNTTSTAQTVTLTNSGTGPLTLSSVTLGGTNASSFASTNNCGSTVAAGASCMLSITFTPSTHTTLTATITLTDNATTSPQTISLSGSTAVASLCQVPPPSTVVHAAPTPSYAASAITATVKAGATPVVGATVTLYAAGTAGLGSAATSLGTQTSSVTGGVLFLAPTCPFNTSMLYLVATGGTVNGTAVGSGTVLEAVLGSCQALMPLNKNYSVNEATTVAAAYSMAQFMSTGGNIGATSANFLGLNLAAATAANLVDPVLGTAPGSSFPSTGTAPSAIVNTLANALDRCVIQPSSCSTLYSAAAPSGGTVPTTTIDAILNIAKNPASSVATIYNYANTPVFAPALTEPPSDWTIYVTYAGGGMDAPSGLGIDSNGNVSVSSYFNNTAFFTNTGTPIQPNGVNTSSNTNTYGLAVDQNDQPWVPYEQTSYGVNQGLGAVTAFAPGGATSTTYSGGGQNFPVAVYHDSGAAAWIVDYGNSHITVLANNGTPISGTNGYTTNLLEFPVAVAVDNFCYGYIANQSSNTLTRIALDGSSYTNYVVGNGPSGVAVDAQNYIWSANYYGDSVGLVSPTGSVLSGAGFTGGGIEHPQGIAADGAGHIWVANYRAPGLSELSGSSSAHPGTVLSPSAGFGVGAQMLEAFALAIDSSGNLWISDFGSNTITEFVGMAVPVKTPLNGIVRIP